MTPSTTQTVCQSNLPLQSVICSRVVASSGHILCTTSTCSFVGPTDNCRFDMGAGRIRAEPHDRPVPTATMSAIAGTQQKAGVPFGRLCEGDDCEEKGPRHSASAPFPFSVAQATDSSCARSRRMSEPERLAPRAFSAEAAGPLPPPISLTTIACRAARPRPQPSRA